MTIRNVIDIQAELSGGPEGTYHLFISLYKTNDGHYYYVCIHEHCTKIIPAANMEGIHTLINVFQSTYINILVLASSRT